MGLWWDVFDGRVKKPLTKACQCTYYLGRVAVSKTIDGAMKITTVTNSVLSCSYALGCAAVSMVKGFYYLPVTESRDKIVQVFTHPATKEAFKLVAPGGAQAAYNIVGSVLLGNNQNENDIDEQNKYEHVIQQLKVMQAENEKMHKQLNKLVMTTTNNSSSSTDSEQKPEEVIQGDLLDNHGVVPSTSRRSKI